MKDFIYGTKDYLENKVTLAETKHSLLNEAVAARLAKCEIKAADFGLYAELLKDAENSIDYAKKELDKLAESKEAE